MNSYFDRLNLEMVALESAIGAFETENDISEGYLHDYSYEEEPATESSSSSDDFGFDLFGDFGSPATEDAEPSDSAKGSKLSQGIKKILNAIKGFFIKCKDGIVSLFQSFKKKKAEVKAEDVKNKVAPEALELATTMRGSIKQAFNIIKNISDQDNARIAKICKDISKAIDGVGGSDTLRATHNSKIVQAFDSDAAQDKMSELGKSFRGNGKFDGNDDEQRAGAEKVLTEAEDTLDKVKKTGEDLDAALNNVKAIFTKEFTAAYNKMKNRVNKEATAVTGTNDYDREHDEAVNNRTTERDRRADKKAVDDFNKEAKKKNSVGLKDVRVDNIREISMGTLAMQTKQTIFIDYDMSAVQTAVNSVVTACSKHAANCENIASKSDNANSRDAKIAYQMCRVLSNASNIYTHISNSISRLLSGDVFKVTLNDGHGSDESYFKANYQDRLKAKDGQKKYLDE